MASQLSDETVKVLKGHASGVVSELHSRRCMKTHPAIEPVTGRQLASCVGGLSPTTGLVAYGKARERMGMVADRLETMQLFRGMGALGPAQESQMVEFQARYDKARRQSELLGARLNARFKAW